MHLLERCLREAGRNEMMKWDTLNKSVPHFFYFDSSLFRVVEF